MTNSKNKSGDESLVARWSRRKLQSSPDQVDEAFIDEDSRPGIEDDNALKAAKLREQKLAELNALTDEDMPDLDSLDEHSDFSPFMSSNVSEGLRNLALRKLFHSEGFNIRDGLDEYDGDYTSFEKLDPTTITADMRHRMEIEAKKLKEALLNDEETGPDDTDSLSEESLPDHREITVASEETSEQKASGITEQESNTAALSDTAQAITVDTREHEEDDGRE